MREKIEERGTAEGGREQKKRGEVPKGEWRKKDR